MTIDSKLYHRGSLSESQVAVLARDMSKDHISYRKGGRERLAYIEGWRAIDLANQVFGFDGWNFDIVEVALVSERVIQKSGDNGAYKQIVVIVRARVRVHALGVSREDIGICVGQASEANADAAHDMAWKGSVTDALKRALRTFGMQFGLALYDKELAHVGPSSSAQSLLAEARELPEESDALKGWYDEHRDEIEALAEDEKQQVYGLLNAKKAKVVLAWFAREIDAATKESRLVELYEKAKNEPSIDRPTLDRLAARCKARKGQLQKDAA